MTQAQTPVQNLIGKFKRGQRGECCRKWKLIQFFDTHFGQPRCARSTAHQSERGTVWRKICPRMWIKRHDTQRRINCRRPRHFNDRAVPEVHAIKVANRSGSAAIGVFYKLVIRDNPHAPVSSGAGGSVQGQSNLREGAKTVASPISTFLPSTEQWQSILTMRLAGSMSVTLTSA